MNEQAIRNIVRQEMARNSQASRFNLTNTTRHQHTRNDIAPINQSDIAPGNSVEGSIAFAQKTTYNIGVNFNPSQVIIHGNAVHDNGDTTFDKFIIVGVAKFGPSLYLQPGVPLPATSTYVKPGGTPQTIIQSNTYFGVTATGAVHTLIDEEHIANVSGYPTKNDVYVRATITSYSNKGIILSVDTLASGWTFNLSWTIT